MLVIWCIYVQQAHEWPMKTHQLSTHIPTPNVRSENTKSATRVWKPHSCGTSWCHTSVHCTLVWHFLVFSNLADWFGTCVGTCRLCWMCRPNCHAFMSVCGAGDRYWINAMATQNQRGGLLKHVWIKHDGHMGFINDPGNTLGDMHKYTHVGLLEPIRGKSATANQPTNQTPCTHQPTSQPAITNQPPPTRQSTRTNQPTTCEYIIHTAWADACFFWGSLWFASRSCCWSWRVGPIPNEIKSLVCVLGACALECIYTYVIPSMIN